MGQPKKCLVTFRDDDGVEHIAEVVAASLYEAGALALQQFRRGDWSREASLGFRRQYHRLHLLWTQSLGFGWATIEGWLLLTAE